MTRPARGFVRFLYSSNPFYILSADLVFVGLRMSFGAGGPASLELGARRWDSRVTRSLMATTACFLIRVGKLWDDLRSLLILIVMMFLAMAMSGDETMAADPAEGRWAARAVFCSRSSSPRRCCGRSGCDFPAGIVRRITSILALVFLYPIALAPF